MRHVTRFFRWLALCGTPDEVVVAQFRELARQLPGVYIVMTLNAMISNHAYFPRLSTGRALMIDAAMIAVGLAGVRGWKRMNRYAPIRAAEARRTLRLIVAIAIVLAVAQAGFGAWVRWYNAAFDESCASLLVAATIIGCVFCLVPLPQAAIPIVPITILPYIERGAHPPLATLATVIGAVLISVIVTRTLNSGFATFTKLVQSRAALEAGRREAERLTAESVRVAHVDSLTGLPNRRYFFAQLDMLTEQMATTGQRFAIGLVDLDRFKPVNDSYGHAMGDRLLVALAGRLAMVADEKVIVARLGGDEFGLLLLDCDGTPTDLGQRVCDLLSRPVMFDDFRLSVGASCGLAVFPEAGLTARELFDRSDYALYHAKSSRRGNCILFTAEHETRIRSGQVLEAALQAANFEEEMDVHFQPVVETGSLRPVMVEALARWESPVLGAVPPDQFIAVAEGLGMMRRLTPILFRKTLSHASRLPPEIGLSFNLSANDIVVPETVAELIAILRAARFDPARVTMEITETAVIRDFAAAVAGIETVRALGVRVALDDFGTGSSSLTHLHRLPLDVVKVDRGFAAGLCDRSGGKIVSAISSLCQNLGLECVIEGIESLEQLLIARQFGYRRAQGYLFAKPMGMDALVVWLMGEGLSAPIAGERRA